MHLLVRETRSLDEDAPAVELGHSPADIVVLSFSDSDLGALAAAWTGARSLRLVQLSRLRHPMSVDLYVEQVIAHARCVIVRILGGIDYWAYGAEELSAACLRSGAALALLPGDARDDPRLRGLSTVADPALDRLDRLFRAGGPDNMARLLDYASHLAGLGGDECASPLPVRAFGVVPLPAAPGAVATIVLYRSHMLAGDIAPVHALAACLQARGLAPRALYVDSLKSPTAPCVSTLLRIWNPAVLLNLTGFSAWRDRSGVLDAPGAPVLQCVLAGTSRDAWCSSARGLSQTDLAMHVALPELDGRLLTGAISFKAEANDVPGLQFTRTVNAPDDDGLALAADRAAGWARLATLPRSARRVAIVLSDYPGAGGQLGHAVGLDTFASLAAILRLLDDAGYDTMDGLAAADLRHAVPTDILSSSAYAQAFAALPAPLQDRIVAAWGPPAGPYALCHVRQGRAVLLIEPDRGGADRRASYHDPDLPPCHAYVATRLWLRREADVIVHLGAHGSFEWLPGKAVALSAACTPRALLGGLPVIYPFIVNNPGEAAAAKRRLGAVTIGHLTPPLAAAALHGPARALERLIDEYAAADGLDRRRTAALRRTILEQADETGLLAESGAAGASDDDRLARLDAYLCDLKDLQVRDGLHVFGEAPRHAAALLAAIPGAPPDALDVSAASERAALLTALDGRFVPPGPAGAPTQGRADVLPTGRNLTSLDPRALPTRSALTLAERTAAAIIRRHCQDHGEPPRRVVIDAWGSASLRTGGEDLALGLVLMGVRPTWDEGSSRVNGFEVLPLAVLDRPRVDVTLRISGLFRDVFEGQVALFDAAVQAVAGRDEATDWNPLAGEPAPVRVFGPAEGSYGAGDGTAAGWLAASGAGFGRHRTGSINDRVAAADTFVHAQDMRELDLLEGPEHGAHEGGFAAAARSLGADPALYHVDTSTFPRVRTVTEEITRIVRGRAANPVWLGGMARHGYRGAAEIARSVHGLASFAASLPDRFDAQFDLLHAATLGDPAIDAFLRAANPAARSDMQARFAAAHDAGLWHPKRNAQP